MICIEEQYSTSESGPSAKGAIKILLMDLRVVNYTSWSFSAKSWLVGLCVYHSKLICHAVIDRNEHLRDRQLRNCQGQSEMMKALRIDTFTLEPSN